MEEGIRVRVEAMRMEVISSDKIAINENGVAVTIDYLVPAGKRLPFDWKAPTTATLLIDLDIIATAVETECVTRPARAMTSRKIVKAICACTSIKKSNLNTGGVIIWYPCQGQYKKEY